MAEAAAIENELRQVLGVGRAVKGIRFDRNYLVNVRPADGDYSDYPEQIWAHDDLTVRLKTGYGGEILLNCDLFAKRDLHMPEPHMVLFAAYEELAAVKKFLVNEVSLGVPEVLEYINPTGHALDNLGSRLYHGLFATTTSAEIIAASVPLQKRIIPTLFIHPGSALNFISKIFKTADLISADVPGPEDEEGVLMRERLMSYYFTLIGLLFPTFIQHIHGLPQARRFLNFSATRISQPDNIISQKQLLADAFLLFGYMGKNYSIESVHNWYEKRLSALFKSTDNTGITRDNTAKFVSDFWSGSLELRQAVFEFFLNYEPEETHPMYITMKELKKQVLLILGWSEMRLYLNAYNYITGFTTVLLLNPAFLDQADHLVTTFNQSRTLWGDKHQYARLLNKTSESHDVAKFPDVALATVHYMRTVSETWKNFQRPNVQNVLSEEMIKERCGKFITTEQSAALDESARNKLAHLGKDPAAIQAHLTRAQALRSDPRVAQYRALREELGNLGL